MTLESLTTAQKVRATLHRDVRSICTECCHFLGLEITKPAMEVIAELLYKKLTVYAGDLEAFAKHAKRSTINTEDVKLLIRRNHSLRAHLNKIQPMISTSNKEKRRKTDSLVAEQPNVDQPKEIEMQKETTSGSTYQPIEQMAVDTIDLTFDENK